MQVILANHSGFCFGVQKAIERTRQELAVNIPKGRLVYSLGPVIHNRQVVESLEKQGLITIQQVDEATGGTVIIRSHGVPESIYEEIEAKSLQLVDTTCPFVKKIQTIVREHHRQGSVIVIIGNADHPEVMGINGWCDNQGIIVNQLTDLKDIPSDRPLCVVAQTTTPMTLFEEITDELLSQNSGIKVHNTICVATRDRQKAARELSQHVEAMVVIGGSHSSNTKKMAEVCHETLPKDTYLIEEAVDLPLGRFKSYQRVGVTAGASTPDEVINETVSLLQGIEGGTNWQIAVDGPAGAGKSTIAKRLAACLQFTYIDTGAMYRALTYKALQKGLSLNDPVEMTKIAHNSMITIQQDRLLLDGYDVTDKIRSSDVTTGVSTIAGIKTVRQQMVKLQQEIAGNSDVIMDGRDIGTVVLPNADLKIYLTASVEERARRRFEEVKDKQKVTFQEICRQIQERDLADETRLHDPLVPADDAVKIDTTSLSIDEVVKEIITLLYAKVRRKKHV
mgnify:CR=1 FL=1